MQMLLVHFQQAFKFYTHIFVYTDIPFDCITRNKERRTDTTDTHS